MTTFTDTINEGVTQLLSASDHAIDMKSSKASGLANMLAGIQEAERQGVSLNDARIECLSINGYSHKIYNPTHDKFIEVEGDKAPANLSTAFSEAKRALIQEGSLLGFQTWEEMRKACKPVDPLTDVKNAQKRINKALKSLNSQDWNDYATGSIEKLADELEKLVK